jgi:transposase
MADYLNNKPYGAWIAIDVAKDFNAVLSETKEGKRQHFRMANSAADHERFIAFSDLAAPCLVGFEATSNYHRAWDIA